MKFFCLQFFRPAAAALALLFFAAQIFAQPAQPAQPGRYLFIFETSPTLKRALPSVEKTLDMIFFDSLRGHLQDGDEIGIWTVDDKLHAGQFPLTSWSAAGASAFTERVKDFLHQQSYSTSGNLGALTSSLGHVAESSDRLTVFIFCDGQSPLTGTQFDFGVNQIFKEAAAAQKKARQPFIVVLRAQLGKFVAATATLSPNTLNVPDFPPLPPPPAPVVVVSTNKIIRPAPAVTPSLIIVGTNVSTDPSVTAAYDKTNAPPAVTKNVPAPATNKPAAMPPRATNVISSSTNLSANASPSNSVTSNVAPKPLTNEDSHRYIVTLLCVAAALLVVLIVSITIRSRRPRGSLITGSMNQPQPPSRRK